MKTIFKFMKFIRKSIACYLKNVYNTKEISNFNGNKNYAIDESLFTHVNNEQIWVIGIINTSDKTQFRCNYSKIRNTDYLKAFIEKYIKAGNCIISDGWSGYNFLNDENSGYHHISYNHGAGNWGVGEYSTSHIESMWAYLNKSIKKIYYSIPSKGFYYFLKQEAFRYINCDKNEQQLLYIIRNILKFNFNSNGFNFENIFYLNNLNN